MSTKSESGVVGPANIKRPRDVRLDFFRGLGMFIIFISHIPMNAWANFIPAKFGFSDAADIFVFCSGMASALAFGRLYDERGFGVGTARIAFRCWQVYWAHVGVFVAVVALMVATDKILDTGTAYVDGLNLRPFLSGDTATNLLGFLTLTYVPNYFDILPMYLVILTMVPVAMALSRVHVSAVFAFVAFMWLGVQADYLRLPAEPWSEREWYFNPFAWQLVFFAGFAFMRGWLPKPPVNKGLMIAAAVVLVLSFPLAHWPTYNQIPWLKAIHVELRPFINKTDRGLLRFAHFLCLAYLAYALAGERGVNLKGRFVGVCCLVGQQALGVFMAGLILSMMAGVALNLMGRNVFTFALVNVAGCLLLIAVAYIAAYFKSQPWLKSGTSPARMTSGQRFERTAYSAGGERTAYSAGGERTAYSAGGERTAFSAGEERRAYSAGEERRAYSAGEERRASYSAGEGDSPPAAVSPSAR